MERSSVSAQLNGFLATGNPARRTDADRDRTFSGETGLSPMEGREVIASKGLDIGTSYLVYVGRHEGLVADGSASGPGGWIGFFTRGEADSFVFAADCAL